MKCTVFICLLVTCFHSAINAQQHYPDKAPPKHERKAVKRSAPVSQRAYFGFGTGLNNPVGIFGLQLDYAVAKKVSVGTGIGISSWGYKTFLEGRYYFSPSHRGWAIGSGVTVNTGLNSVKLKTETIYGDRDIVAHLNPQYNFMLSGYRFFRLGRIGRNRFHLQAGYSVRLKEASFSTPSYPILTKKGESDILAVAPGGVILGLGLSFGTGPLHPPVKVRRHYSGKAPTKLERKAKALKRSAPAYQRAYIGFSTGINNPVGIFGMQLDFAVAKNLSVGTGFGFSSWGYKTFLEGRYYFSPNHRGWAIGSGATMNTGLNSVRRTAETIYGDQYIVAHLNTQYNFMLSGYHFFRLGRSGRNRFHLQAGYSLRLSEASFSSSSYPILTKKGEEDILALAPGGVILGLGISFGTGTSR